jgi:hypothetical protein
VRLEPTGEDTTTLHYTANAQVGGKIAQIGSRLIDMTAQKMAGEFFDKFEAALRAKYPPAEAAAPAPASPGLFARLLRWLRGLLG